MHAPAVGCDPISTLINSHYGNDCDTADDKCLFWGEKVCLGENREGPVICIVVLTVLWWPN